MVRETAQVTVLVTALHFVQLTMQMVRLASVLVGPVSKIRIGGLFYIVPFSLSFLHYLWISTWTFWIKLMKQFLSLCNQISWALKPCHSIQKLERVIAFQCLCRHRCLTVFHLPGDLFYPYMVRLKIFGFSSDFFVLSFPTLLSSVRISCTSEVHRFH